MGTSECLRKHALDQLDVAFLSYLISEHRLSLIAYPSLKATFPASSNYLTRLTKIVRQYGQKFLRSRAVLVRVSRVLTDAQIPFVVLKGQPLNSLLYGNQCIRYSCDIDLLIYPADIFRAHHCFQEAGLTVVEGGPTPEKLHFTHRVLADYLYRDTTYNIRIELHRQVTSVSSVRFYPDCDMMQFVELSGVSLPTFDHETNFVYLCLHAAKHNWNRLQWLVDLGVYVQRVSLDWSKVEAVARRYHLVRAVLEARLLLCDCFGLTSSEFRASFLDRFCAQRRISHAKRIWNHPLDDHNFIRAFYVCLLFPLWRQKGDHLLSLFKK